MARRQGSPAVELTWSRTLPEKVNSPLTPPKSSVKRAVAQRGRHHMSSNATRVLKFVPGRTRSTGRDYEGLAPAAHAHER